MDKCSNNFVSNCKKHYVASVFNDINSLGGTGVKSQACQNLLISLSKVWPLSAFFWKWDLGI
jgi:hypothetical protein